MDAEPSILLRPHCPRRSDPDVCRLLDLVAGSTGALWVELELALHAGVSQRYRRGPVKAGGSTVVLSADGFDATLRVGASEPPPPELASMVSFTLEKVLNCSRYHEQVALLRGALDTTTSAVLLFDAGGGIVYANPPADRLLAEQTERQLAVVLDNHQTPLVTFLCRRVERMGESRTSQDPWTGTLTLSDGSVLACEIMQVDTGGTSPTSGILALLQPVPVLSRLCFESFCVRNKLSPREADVVGLLLEGLTTAAMADRLTISLHTVRDHLKRLYRKTGARSRSELLSLLSTAGSPPAFERARAGIER